VTEPVRRHRELDRHEGPAVLVGRPVAAQRDHRCLAGDLLVDGARRPDELVAHDGGEEVVRHGPLVVPAGQPAGRLEDPFGADSLRADQVDDPVVEPGHALVQLDDDEVLVVARLRDDRVSVAAAGHIEHPVDVGRHQQLHGVRGIVELRLP
jgi:hypothetical protein